MLSVDEMEKELWPEFVSRGKLGSGSWTQAWCFPSVVAVTKVTCLQRTSVSGSEYGEGQEARCHHLKLCLNQK